MQLQNWDKFTQIQNGIFIKQLIILNKLFQLVYVGVVDTPFSPQVGIVWLAAGLGQQEVPRCPVVN